MTERFRFLRWFFAVALLAGILVGLLWNIERAATGRAAALPSAEEAPSHAGSRRMFILAIDSLRYQTAMDPDLMPYLAELRERSTFAKVQTTHDAVTFPSMRAAFTGRDHVNAFSVFDRFARGTLPVESVFAQAREAGVHTQIMSDGSFDQFGGGRVASMVDNRLGNGDDVESQVKATRALVRRFEEGSYDFAVAHVTYGDHAAHAYGVHDGAYVGIFRDLDALIKRVDKTVSKDATLVVMGDHGHTERGDHGLSPDDVPTIMLYRGKGFAQGLDLGTVAITDHRYFLDFALQLPLPRDYARGRHPEALVATTALPKSFAVGHDALAGVDRLADFPRSERAGLVLLAAYVALLSCLWLLFLRLPADAPATVALSFTALPLAFASMRPFHAIAGLALAGGWLAHFGARALGTRRRALAAGGVAIAAGLALFAWGWLLATLRPVIHEPRGYVIDRVVLCAFIAAGLWTVIRGPRTPIWASFVVVGVLCYSSVYRYGGPGLFVPLWLCWMVVTFLPEARRLIGLERANAELAERSAGRRRVLSMVALGAPVVLLLFPFNRTFSNQFCFEEWHGPLAPDTRDGWLYVAVAAKLVVFVRPWGPVWQRISSRAERGAAIFSGIVLVAGISFLEWHPTSLHAWSGALAIAILLGATVLAKRRKAAGLENIFVLGLYWVSGLYLLRLPAETWAWADWLFAALALSADFARRSTDPTIAKRTPLFVLFLGLFVSGWVTLAWTAHRFEWAFLYDWLSRKFVDDHVAAFLPLLLARYALVVLLVRQIIAAPLGADPADRDALATVGIKFFAGAAVMLGLTCFSVASDLYVEAYEELAVVLILMFGLIVPSPVKAS